MKIVLLVLVLNSEWTHLKKSKVKTVRTIPVRERTTPTIVSFCSAVLTGGDGIQSSRNLEQMSWITD